MGTLPIPRWHFEMDGAEDMGGRMEFNQVSLDAVNLVTYERMGRENGCHWLSARVIARPGAKIVAAWPAGADRCFASLLERHSSFVFLSHPV